MMDSTVELHTVHTVPIFKLKHSGLLDMECLLHQV